MADTRPIITTKSRLAKRLGISAARITAYVAEGLPTRADGTLDQRVALNWIGQHVASDERRPIGQRLGGRPKGRPPLAPPKGEASYGEARRLLEVLKAQRLKLEVDQLRGRLLEREQVTTEVFELGRQYRDSWLNWPSRVAAILAAQWGVDALTVQRDLDVEVRSHLGALRDFTLAPRS
jgi:hypothetical protein